jgi:outer membrane lipoprotein LolB
MNIERLARLGVWVWLVLLTACATPEPRAVVSSNEWSGRLAIQVLKDPPESLSAHFELQGSAQSGQMLLLSPIGTSLARLQWQAEYARLEQGQEQVVGTSLQNLAARLTGTELPIAALFDWLAGRPSEASGWQVDLSSHAQGRITAERRLPAPVTVLRIVLDR